MRGTAGNNLQFLEEVEHLRKSIKVKVFQSQRPGDTDKANKGLDNFAFNND